MNGDQPKYGFPHYPNVKCGCCTPEQVNKKDRQAFQEKLKPHEENQSRIIKDFEKFVISKQKGEDNELQPTGRTPQ